MYEILVECDNEFIVWDNRMTEKQALQKAAELRKQKKAVKIRLRDADKVRKEERRSRFDRDEEE